MPVDLFAEKDMSAPKGKDLFAPEIETSAITGKPIERPRLTMPEVKSAMEFVNQREPGIDYYSGIRDANFRAYFSEADNEKERRDKLNRAVGEGNWKKDQFGAFIIKPKGLDKLGQPHSNLPVALDEQGLSLMDVADMAGDAPAIAGSIAAAYLTGGMSLVPALGTMFVGTAGGKALGEIGEELAGENIQTPMEVTKDVLISGGEGMLGEGIFRTVARPIGRRFMAPEAHRMTTETRQLVDMASEINVQPSVSQITKAPILGRTQAMINRIFGGDPLEPKNVAALLKEADRLKSAAGREAIKTKDVGVVVSKGIQKRRKVFSETVGKVYNDVDIVVGDKPIIPTRMLKEQASTILEELPKAADGTPVFTSPEMQKTLTDVISMPNSVPAKQMQAVRNVLFDNFQTGNLVPGMSARQTRSLWHAAGDSFDDAVKTINVTSGLTEGQVKRSLMTLKKANRIYSKGIKKFDDQLVSRITRDPSMAGAIDPDLLVETIFKKGNPSRLAKIRRLTPKEDWDLVKRKAMDDIMSKMISRTDDPRIDMLNAKKFLNVLDSYGRETLDGMFDKELTDGLYRLGKVMQFVTQKQGQSGGLVAANIALHPIANLGKLAQLNIMSKFLNSKLGLKWFTEGLSAPKTRAGATAISRAALLMATIADEETGVAKVTLTPPMRPEDIQTMVETPVR